MPSPDEIIASFKEVAKNEAWAKQANNPQALAQAEQQLRDLLNETDPNQYSAKAYKFMQDFDCGPSVGTATCQALLNKGDAGKAVCVDVAKRVMSSELDKYSVSAGGFIRGQHSINGLTKEFIQSTSPDCERQVKERVEAVAQKYKAAGIDQVASGNNWQAKTQITSDVGKDMVELLATTPLTQESASFLKEMRDTIEQHKGFAAKYQQAKPGATAKDIENAQRDIADIVVNNNSALRFTSPLIRTNPTLGGNDLWKSASGASLTTFSKAQKETIQVNVKHSNVGPKGEPKVLAPEELAENKFQTDVANNIHTARGMVVEMQEKLSAGRVDPNLAAQKHREMQDLTKKFEPQMAKIAENEKRLAALNKPISVEKIKAFFSRKGVEGTKADLKAEVLDMQQSLKKSMDDVNSRIAVAKDKQDVHRKTGLDPDKLEQALQLPAVNKAMYNFAKKEHSTENLDFHNAVADFNKLVEGGASVADIRNAAENLRKSYIADGSPNQVNLRHDVREKCEATLDKLGKMAPDENNFHTWKSDVSKQYGEAFKGADGAVMEMTQMDTWARFKLDQSYKEAMQKSAKNGLDDPSVAKTLGIDRNAPKVEAPRQKLVVK